MKTDYTDVELAEIAEWAEAQERLEADANYKKAYGAIRQGMDWLLRARTRRRQKELESADTPTPQAKVVRQ